MKTVESNFSSAQKCNRSVWSKISSSEKFDKISTAKIKKLRQNENIYYTGMKHHNIDFWKYVDESNIKKEPFKERKIQIFD